MTSLRQSNPLGSITVTTFLFIVIALATTHAFTPAASSIRTRIDTITTTQALSSSRTTTSTASSVDLNTSATTASDSSAAAASPANYPRFKAVTVKAGMMTFIAAMCVALPITLAPQYAAYKLGLLDRVRKERLALSTGQFCARWLIRIVPFCKLQAVSEIDKGTTGSDASGEPKPAVWVCNHTSMLDVFLLMAADRKLRGRRKRPMKIVYWKKLEDNPVTKLLFRQCGFIAVQMAANEPGSANDYDVSSFKKLLKDSKQAFAEGFDIGILPEGQLNPSPEQGLMPIFSGAFTLARLSKRPVNLMALYGAHRLWHPIDGMHVKGRDVLVRSYPVGRYYRSSDEFVATFEKVVGHFGTTGADLPEAELQEWLTGKAWDDDQERISAATATATAASHTKNKK